MADKICYVITERDGKAFWMRVGVATTNKDGSIQIKLDALPVNGELQIRDRVPREARSRRSPSAASTIRRRASTNTSEASRGRSR